MNNPEKDLAVSELTKYLKASLLLQIRSLPENEKPEFLLYRAGFSRNEIADLLGKKYETVKKTLQLLKLENGKTKSKEMEDEREGD